MRKWKEMKTDEILSVWNCYLRTDFGCDPLRLEYIQQGFQMRLTSTEIAQLVQELIERIIELEKLKE